MREIARLVLVLGLIAACSAAALSYVRTALEPRIERQSDFYVRGPALERLFGAPASEVLGNKIIVEADGLSYPIFYFQTEGRLAGLAVEAPGKGGYGGDIVIMVGLDLESGKMLGVEIISHSETPGLGAQVEKASFRRQWRNLEIGSPAALSGNGGRIDAITGATYSSKAMIDGTNQIVDLLMKHEEDVRAMIARRDDRASAESGRDR